MKKKIIKKKPLVFLLIALTLGVIGITFAFIHTEVVTPNLFRVRTYNVGIQEEFYNDFGTKKVSFVNNDKNGVPVLLRMHYNENWVQSFEEDGEIIEKFLDAHSLPNGSYQETVTKNWTNDFNTLFKYNQNDGWYYYRKVLNGNEAIQILESITKNPNLPDDYQGYEYHLTFNMEAIQATATASQTNWGQRVRINGGEVEWRDIQD